MDRKPYIRISPDIDALYIDSDSCCAIAFGDEICNECPSLGGARPKAGVLDEKGNLYLSSG